MGTAVTIASEAPLHARGAKKIPGAQEGIYLIRNSDRVANICNDVVGDIAGTLSGAIGISLIIEVVVILPQGSQLLMNLLMAGTIAAVTIGGKAMGKRIAVREANKIIFLVARALVTWKKLTRSPFSKTT